MLNIDKMFSIKDVKGMKHKTIFSFALMQDQIKTGGEEMRRFLFPGVLLFLMLSNGFLMLQNESLQRENRKMRVFASKEEKREEEGESAEILARLLKAQQQERMGLSEISVGGGRLTVRASASDIGKLREKEERISEILGRRPLRKDLQMSEEGVRARLDYGGGQ